MDPTLLASPQPTSWAEFRQQVLFQGRWLAAPDRAERAAQWEASGATPQQAWQALQQVGDELHQWVFHGFNPAEAPQWYTGEHRFACSPVEWRRDWWPLEEARDWEQQLNHRRERLIAPHEARRWQELGYEAQDVGRLAALINHRRRAAALTPSCVERWRTRSIEPDATVALEEMEEWMAASVVDVQYAEQWRAGGWSAEQAGIWMRAGVAHPHAADLWAAAVPGSIEDAAQEAKQWAAAGITYPESAKLWQDEGFSAQDAGRWKEAPHEARVNAITLLGEGIDAELAGSYYQVLHAASGSWLETARAYHREGLGPQDIFLYRPPGSNSWRKRTLAPRRLASYMKATGLSGQQAGQCLREKVPEGLAATWADELRAGAQLDELMEHWKQPPSDAPATALGELLG